MQSSRIPIHIGIMGHIDAGKTSIARALSELISTAGLDKHSQSKDRGITIDLGFTFFPLEEFMVTLVDAPGHADLIRSVVSGASIIDMAFVVVDALKGPQVQTGEHLVILDVMQIPKVLILLNKIDLIQENQLQIVTKQIKLICNQTRFKDSYEIFPISAVRNQGFDAIKNAILNYFRTHQINRVNEGSFKFLFDHHFAMKGQGTVLTGTVLRGSAQIGDKLVILPQEFHVKIKSIQRWKQSVSGTIAGDRVGIAVSELDPASISRGCIAVKDPYPMKKGQIFETMVTVFPLFSKSCRFGEQVTINHGMMTIVGRIFPIQPISFGKELKWLRLDPDKEIKEFRAIIWLEIPEFVEKDDRFLITRLDLPPTSLRIMGTARIQQILSEPIEVHRLRIKQGQVKNPNYTATSVIVEGLSDSVDGARTLIGESADLPFGKILGTFGTKGNVEIEIELSQQANIRKEQPVTLKLTKKITMEYSKTY